jgi:carbon monoxide dehydrogenase subunit G
VRSGRWKSRPPGISADDYCEKEVLVERPADEVFDFLADVRNEERWNPNVLRIESEADGPLTVGGTFEGVYRRGGGMRFELVEAVRPSRLVFRGGGRQMTLVGTLELEQAGLATRVRMKGEMEPRGLMKLLAPLMRKPMDRQYATVAETFRQVAAMENAGPKE